MSPNFQKQLVELVTHEVGLAAAREDRSEIIAHYSQVLDLMSILLGNLLAGLSNDRFNNAMVLLQQARAEAAANQTAGELFRRLVAGGGAQ